MTEDHCQRPQWSSINTSLLWWGFGWGGCVGGRNGLKDDVDVDVPEGRVRRQAAPVPGKGGNHQQGRAEHGDEQRCVGVGGVGVGGCEGWLDGSLPRRRFRGMHYAGRLTTLPPNLPAPAVRVVGGRWRHAAAARVGVVGGLCGVVCMGCRVDVSGVMCRRSLGWLQQASRSSTTPPPSILLMPTRTYIQGSAAARWRRRPTWPRGEEEAGQGPAPASPPPSTRRPPYHASPPSCPSCSCSCSSSFPPRLPLAAVPTLRLRRLP